MKTRPKTRIAIAVMSCIAGLSLILGAFFWHAFYIRYGKWHAEIVQVQSSFVTPEGENVTSAGIFWAFPALMFSVIAIVLVIFTARRILKAVRVAPLN